MASPFAFNNDLDERRGELSRATTMRYRAAKVWERYLLRYHFELNSLLLYI